jgi:hypothetical protein
MKNQPTQTEEQLEILECNQTLPFYKIPSTITKPNIPPEIIKRQLAINIITISPTSTVPSQHLISSIQNATKNIPVKITINEKTISAVLVNISIIYPLIM